MNPKRKIKNLLHIKSDRKFRVWFSRASSYKRGRVQALEEATVSGITADVALDNLRKLLKEQGTDDFSVISIESEE